MGPLHFQKSRIIALKQVLTGLIISCLILFLNILCPNRSPAQGATVLDSLKSVLENSIEDTNKVKTLHFIAMQYYSSVKSDTAIQYANKALFLCQRLNYDQGTGLTYKILGDLYENVDDYIEAEKNYKAAIIYLEKTGDNITLGKTWNNLGILYGQQGNYEKTLECYFASLKIKEEIGDKQNIAPTFMNIGDTYTKLNNYTEAMVYLQKSLAIAEEFGDNRLIAKSLNSMGSILWRQGNTPGAFELYQKALNIFEEIDDKTGIANAYGNIGNVMDVWGMYPEALNYTLKALKVHEEIGNKINIAISYNNISLIYGKMGDFESELKTLQDALKIFNELDAKYFLANTYNNIGIVYANLGYHQEALENYQTALKIAEENNYKEFIGDSYLNIGNYYQNTKNYPEALKYLTMALDISEQTDVISTMLIAKVNIGLVLIHLNDLTESRSVCHDAISLYKKIGDKEGIMECYKLSHAIDSAEGKYKDALENYKLYTSYKDSLLNEKTSNQLTGLKIQYESEKKDKEIELLNKDNDIKALHLEKQEASLMASMLQTEKNRNELLLLTTTKELQELQLANTKEELDQQHLLSEAQKSEIALINKEKELKEQLLSKQRLQRNGAIISIAFLLVIGFLLFRSLHLRKKLEKQSAIIQERKRISADLHDDIGTGLSKISLLSELVRSQAKTPAAKKEAEIIADTSKELLQSIGEIIWALNANNDHLENLVSYIRRYAAGYFEHSSVDLKITAPGIIPQAPVSGECRRNIFYAVKEALHNIVKHAQASRAEIKISLDNSLFSVVIRDDGSGMPEGELNRFGNGIRNMKNRMEKINGKFIIENDCGTKVTLVLPV